MEELIRFTESESSIYHKESINLHKSIIKSYKNKQLDIIKEYIYSYDEDFFYDFTEFFIIPFLKSHGYLVNADIKKIATNLQSWAGSHYYASINKSKDFVVTYVNEVERGDEYEWFLYCIPFDELNKACEEWAEEDFLDDSDCGNSQRSDFHTFLWQHIDLYASKSHHIWLEQNYDSDEEDDYVYRHNDGPQVYEKRKHNSELY